MHSISHTWGTTSAERQLSFACDQLIKQPDYTLFRAVTIHATSAVVFRWLCQLRVAPYSYDLIDNGGRQSPQRLIEGLEQLEVGQDVMTIFELVDFTPDKHLTIRIKPGGRALQLFGDFAVTYQILPVNEENCRLLVKIVVKRPPGVRGMLMSKVLPWGDLIMMRRQLLNLKELSERTFESISAAQ